MTLDLRVRRVGGEQQRALAAHLGEAHEVGVLPHGGRVVELEVARVDDGPERRPDDESGRVGNRVRDGEELHGERADVDRLSRLHDLDVRVLLQAMLAQLHIDEAAREPGAEHRHVDLAQQERQRADVVLVAVGEEHRLQARGVVQDVLEVRDHEVDAEHLLLGEHQPHVDGDRLVVVLVEHHVAPDLAEAAERDHADGQGVLGHRTFTRFTAVRAARTLQRR